LHSLRLAATLSWKFPPRVDISGIIHLLNHKRERTLKLRPNFMGKWAMQNQLKLHDDSYAAMRNR
jgi:hypothetical protein